MDLQMFLPNTYHFVKQNYVLNGEHFNQFSNTYSNSSNISKMLLAIGIILFLLPFIPVAIRATKNKAENLSITTVSLMLAGSVALLISFFTFKPASNYESNLTNFGNGFETKNTNFIVQPNEQAFADSGSEYLLKNKAGILEPKSSNYAIYAKVYNDKLTSYKIYLVGNMVNKHFTPITERQKENYQDLAFSHLGTLNFTNETTNKRLMTSKQLNALNTYIEFIKKYHLENNFKHNAKLIMSNKYYGADYAPQLVMKGKDDRVLYLKHNIDKKDIANVGITK